MSTTTTTVGRGGHARDDWQQRRDETLKLRSTCAGCGHEGLTMVPHGRGSRPERCECGGSGMSLKEIGAALGISTSTASQYLNDPDRTAARAARARRKHPCVECGHMLDSGQGKRTTYRCVWCQEGRPSPTRIANSPTGFRFIQSKVCGVPGCSDAKRDGGHVCDGHAERYAAIRAELESESADVHATHNRVVRRATRRAALRRRRSGGSLGVSGLNLLHAERHADPAAIAA